MGQILHGSATTTYAVRAAIQRSKATAKALAAQHGLNPKTVAKWKKRDFVHDAAMGPKDPRSSVLTPEEEAVAIAFRRYTLLPLDDCLYALRATIPQLTRSSLHRLFQRHGISRLPEPRRPLGKRGEELHTWMLGTRMFQQMIGKDGGSQGVDNDYATRSMEGFGAFILGRNMFGPVRGDWPDGKWNGWWGDNPPYHTPTFVLTHYPRDPR